MSRGRFLGWLTALLVLEAAALAVGGPDGRKLRILVDLWTWQALGLSILGAFLAADRPFLAVRALQGRSLGGRREERLFGAVTLAAGVALFALSAGAWKLWGGP